MNKVITLLTIAIVVFSIYIWQQPNSKSKIINLPDISGVVATGVATPPPLDMTKIKTEDITIGEGMEIKDGAKVSVQYKGTLVDGTEFDSSYSRDNTPLEFTVGAGQMIPGFDYGVKGMKVGGTRKIIIPPELGYGNRKVGTIPENSTLVFEVMMEKAE